MTEPNHEVERFRIYSTMGAIETVRYSDWEAMKDERDLGARYIEGWQERVKEVEAERDQARDLNRENRAEAEKAWLKVQALEEEIERLRGELGTAEDVAAGALACDNCDDGIYYEGEEWTPCTECEQGKTLTEHFKTCAKEAKAQALAEVREALKPLLDEYTEAVEAFCRGERGASLRVNGLEKRILSTLEGTQGEEGT